MKFPHRSEGHKKFNFFVHFSRKGQTKVRSPMNLTRSVSSTEAVSLFEVIQRESRIAIIIHAALIATFRRYGRTIWRRERI